MLSVGPAPMDTSTGAGATGAVADSSEEEKLKKQSVWYEWKFPLQELRKQNRDREYSPEFELDGEKWRILVFPKGNPSHPTPGCMAAYLELRDQGAWYTVVAHFRFRMLHPTDQAKNEDKKAWRESTHTFTQNEVDRGFNDLLTPATIAEYTWPDGNVVMQACAYKAPKGFQQTRGYGYEAYVPYDSKASTGFCGILNQGATCYMNSMLQALYLLPKFREVVYSIPSEIDDKGAKIGFALQRVFYALQSGNKGVSTKQLTASFGWNSVDAFQVSHACKHFGLFEKWVP